MEMLLHPPGGKKYVIFTDVLDLARIKSEYCGFSVVPNQVSAFGVVLRLIWRFVVEGEGVY